MLKGCKFEVGKEYECANGMRAICRYAFNTDEYYNMFGEVTRRVNGSTYSKGSHGEFSGSGWKEYHEPLVEKIIKYLCAGHYNDYNVTEVKYSGCVGTFELTMTDGKLTDVRIVS